MDDRDEQILRHIGRYHLSLRPVIEQLFFDGGDCSNVIKRLRRDKRIVARDGLPRRMSYYQLTRSEAKRLALPESRARPPKGQAIHTDLSVLWFCTMCDEDRYRLEAQSVEKLFPDSSPNGIHCIERDEDDHTVYRIRVTAADSDDAGLIRSLRKTINQTLDHEGLRLWVKTGNYAFVILTESRHRVESIEEALRREDQLIDLADIHVEFAPGYETIFEALNERRKNARDA